MKKAQRKLNPNLKSSQKKIKKINIAYNCSLPLSQKYESSHKKHKPNQTFAPLIR